MNRWLIMLATTLALAPAAASAQAITVLSSRPDTVSGGDALIAVALPKGSAASDVKVTLGSSDVTSGFKKNDGALIGLVTDLKPGKNVLKARVAGRNSRLTLFNHDRSGPVFSGPQQQPFICETEAFKLPDGSTLGPAQDAACNAPTKVIFVYRSTSDSGFKVLPTEGPLPEDMAKTTTLSGQTVNYIVRLETGVINRSIYQIAVLFDPAQDEPPSPTTAYKGWNGRAVFAFGGGSTVGYHQGLEADALLQEDALSRGFAVMVSTLNVMGIVGSDVVSAETASMVKEHFIETFGPLQYMIGWGGSGGSMQQHLIANNYPGILDGITPGASFPDLYTVAPYAADCPLMVKAVAGNQAWTEEQKRAASGLNSWNTCVGWSMIFTPQLLKAKQAERQIPGLPPNSCHPVVPRELTYDPVSNPRGARCDIYTAARNSVGFDPVTGFTWRAFDNVGVQYGLKAYRAGAISAEQFVELNEKIGGYDRDGNYQTARTVADALALQRVYEYGRVNEGGNLDELPVIDIRGNPGRNHDVHDAVKSETMRARLIRANGNAAGQVIVRGESKPTVAGSGDVSHSEAMNLFVLLKMDEWLANMHRDTRSYLGKAAKVVANKPAELATDLCFMADGSRIAEASDLSNAGPCGSKLPYFDDTRMAAGAPLTNDVLKCQLRAFNAADYPDMAPALVTRLKSVFPTGVCDYGKPSVGYRPLKGTWLSYPEPGVAKPLD